MVRPAIAVWTLVVAGVSAQVIPVDQEPRHRVLFTTDALRVLQVAIPAGDTTLEHRHDNDLATVNVENGRTRTRNAGEDWGTPRIRMLGEVTLAEYSGKPTAHTVQSIDQIPYRLVGVENLRPGSWTQHPAVSGPGTKVLTENRAFRVYGVTLDAVNTGTRHVHPVPVFLTLVSGEISVAGADPAKSESLNARGQWAVVAPGQPHIITRSADAQVIEIEVR